MRARDESGARGRARRGLRGQRRRAALERQPEEAPRRDGELEARTLHVAARATEPAAARGRRVSRRTARSRRASRGRRSRRPRSSDREHGEHRQRRRVQPRGEQRPAAGGGALRVRLDEDRSPRSAAKKASHRRGESARRTRGIAASRPPSSRSAARSAERARDEAPGSRASEQRDPALHDREQDRVVVGAARSSACATWRPKSRRWVRLRPTSSATSASSPNARTERRR